MPRYFLKLLSNLPDMNHHGVIGFIERFIPDSFVYFLNTEDDPSIACQKFQNGEFARRQLDLSAIDMDLMCRCINNQIVYLDLILHRRKSNIKPFIPAKL